jgi:hypothetical protein
LEVVRPDCRDELSWINKGYIDAENGGTDGL